MTHNCSCHGTGGKFSQTVAAVLERPRYSPGLILEDSDLTAAVDYTQSLNRLLFRHLFGCGVICGLTVKPDPACGLTITVSSGLALDGCGDPIQLPKDLTFTFDEQQRRKWEAQTGSLWVVLCGKEKFCKPRTLVCDTDEFDGATQATRIRAQAEVTILEEKPACICGYAKPGTDTNGSRDTNAARLATGNRNDGQSSEPDFDACAPDCGCGSACDCGCCVLLAEISHADGVWLARHAGVRRFVRPLLQPDQRKDTSKAAAIVGQDSETSEPIDVEEITKRFRAHLLSAGPASDTIHLADLGIVASPDAGSPVSNP